MQGKKGPQGIQGAMRPADDIGYRVDAGRSGSLTKYDPGPPGRNDANGVTGSEETYGLNGMPVLPGFRKTEKTFKRWMYWNSQTARRQGCPGK